MGGGLGRNAQQRIWESRLGRPCWRGGAGLSASLKQARGNNDGLALGAAEAVAVSLVALGIWMGLIFCLSAQPDLPYPKSGWAALLLSSGRMCFVRVLAVLWARALGERSGGWLSRWC